MELKSIYGNVIFMFEGAKTILELVTAAVAAKKSLSGAYLSGADLRGADLSGAYLSGADLRGADLSGADLSEAYLSGAYLSGAYLSGTDLSGTDLSGTDLSRADLSGAYLSGTDLSGTDLRGADLSGAYLSGAYLSRAYLRGADLSGADLSRKKIAALRAFSGSLYPYEVWAVLYEDGTRAVRMGCHFNTLEEWASIDLRSNNISEFPDDGREISEERVALFELAKAAATRMNLPVSVPQQGRDRDASNDS